jgi:hypothetical protein
VIGRAEAISLVEARLERMKSDGWTYEICGVREHPEVWSVGVQPCNRDGTAAYNQHSFDVNKETGKVQQFT